MASIAAPASVTDVCLAAKAAARGLAATSSAVKDAALLAMAAALEARVPEILEANARDLEAGRESGLSPALMDRLALDEARVAAMAAGVREIVALPTRWGRRLRAGGFRTGSTSGVFECRSAWSPWSTRRGRT